MREKMPNNGQLNKNNANSPKTYEMLKLSQ